MQENKFCLIGRSISNVLMRLTISLLLTFSIQSFAVCIIHAAPMEAVFNFREVSGYACQAGRELKEGVIFRSGELSAATDNDVERLQEYGIETVYDLRSKNSYKIYPDIVPEMTKVKNVPINSKNGKKKSIRKRQAYLQKAIEDGTVLKAKALWADPCSSRYTLKLFRDEHARNQYAKILRQLIQMKGMRPFLVHCVNGKDRAGVTIAVIMLTLGCSEADVIKEYGLTNKAKHLIVGEKEGDAVSVADFRKALKDVKRTWGSFDQYIQKGIGMSKKEVYQLRRLYCG